MNLKNILKQQTIFIILRNKNETEHLKKIAQESNKKIISTKKLNLYFEDPFKHFYIDNFLVKHLLINF